MSCASCHAPDRQFQDGLPVAQGVGTGTRRAMPIAGTAHNAWMFWDGRKDSLWSQALGPLEDAVEHGGNRTRYAGLIQTHYRAEYEADLRPHARRLVAAAGRRAARERRTERPPGTPWQRPSARR